jgi:hypothetical protein
MNLFSRMFRYLPILDKTIDKVSIDTILNAKTIE